MCPLPGKGRRVMLMSFFVGKTGREGRVPPMTLGRMFMLALLAWWPGAAGATGIEGTLAPGGMVIGQAVPGSLVSLDGEPVRVAADGRFVLGFGRDTPLERVLDVVLPDGKAEHHVLRLAGRNFRIERVDGLPPETVTLPPEYYQRRRQETAAVQTARAAESDLLFWSEGFIAPAKGRISGVYGSQRILNGEPRTPHFGLDIAAPAGTPVVAPAAGIIRLAAPDFLLEGGIIILDHGFSISSTFLHLSAVDVRVGQKVARGERIGAIGATGRASGAHLDWRINWRDERLDPGLLLGVSAGDEVEG